MSRVPSLHPDAAMQGRPRNSSPTDRLQVRPSSAHVQGPRPPTSTTGPSLSARDRTPIDERRQRILVVANQDERDLVPNTTEGDGPGQRRDRKTRIQTPERNRSATPPRGRRPRDDPANSSLATLGSPPPPTYQESEMTIDSAPATVTTVDERFLSLPTTRSSSRSPSPEPAGIRRRVEGATVPSPGHHRQATPSARTSQTSLALYGSRPGSRNAYQASTDSSSDIYASDSRASSRNGFVTGTLSRDATGGNHSPAVTPSSTTSLPLPPTRAWGAPYSQNTAPPSQRRPQHRPYQSIAQTPTHPLSQDPAQNESQDSPAAVVSNFFRATTRPILEVIEKHRSKSRERREKRERERYVTPAQILTRPLRLPRPIPLDDPTWTIDKPPTLGSSYPTGSLRPRTTPASSVLGPEKARRMEEDAPLMRGRKSVGTQADSKTTDDPVPSRVPLDVAAWMAESGTSTHKEASQSPLTPMDHTPVSQHTQALPRVSTSSNNSVPSPLGTQASPSSYSLSRSQPSTSSCNAGTRVDASSPGEPPGAEYAYPIEDVYDEALHRDRVGKLDTFMRDVKQAAAVHAHLHTPGTVPIGHPACTWCFLRQEFVTEFLVNTAPLAVPPSLDSLNSNTDA